MGLEPITDALQEHCSTELSYVGNGSLIFVKDRQPKL